MKKIKCLAMIVIACIATGCSDGYKPLNYTVIPPELNDCSFTRLTNSNGGSIDVVRCPNSSTSTSYAQGKTTRRVVTIDGVNYVENKK